GNSVATAGIVRRGPAQGDTRTGKSPMLSLSGRVRDGRLLSLAWAAVVWMLALITSGCGPTEKEVRRVADSVRRDSLRADSIRREFARQDSIHVDSLRRDSLAHESARLAQARMDSVRAADSLRRARVAQVQKPRARPATGTGANTGT